MYIHKTVFGRHVKYLLRVSYRDGRSIRKSTLLNLTKWDKNHLVALREALQMKRANRGKTLESAADQEILRLVSENGWRSASTPFQILSALDRRQRFKRVAK